MRLSPEMADRIDAWRRTQDDLPPRAEAARRAIERGLIGRKRTAAIEEGIKRLRAFCASDLKGANPKGIMDELIRRLDELREVVRDA